MSRKQLARSGGDLTTLGSDDTGCVILHLDMDSYFVSVELLSRPHLRGRPVIVGGSSGRGVVVSASYEAREYGVHAAMPMARAVGLCPQAVVIPPSRGLYGEYSRQVFDIIGQVTPTFSKVSVDEGFIDVSGAVRRLGSPARIAADLRHRIRERTGLVASVGVAATLVVAKLASGRAKPDGLLVVPAAEVDRFLRPMPVEAMPGVGARTQETLARYGIRTIGDLADTDRHWAGRTLGAWGHTLWDHAHGIDDRDIHGGAVKDHSVSAEHTFETDLTDLDRIEKELLRLADDVARRLRKEGKTSASVGLKYRLPDFTTLSRSVTLPAPTDLAAELHGALLPALRRLFRERPGGVRLLGLRASGLVDLAASGRQTTLDLFADGPAPSASSTSSGAGSPTSDPSAAEAPRPGADHPHSAAAPAPARPPARNPEGRREAEVALDAVRARFGTGAIGAASLLPGQDEDPETDRFDPHDASRPKFRGRATRPEE
ncbi:DNA polymerase IV [Brevibacterium litoralis]|uniref:DNA polymerase IV n=1 Tax=Brevibacterium litoralis TaxID=3138935 RepID=UPI0032ED5BB1